MDHKKSSLKASSALFFTCVLLLACATLNASAITIDQLRVDMDDTRLDPGQEFTLNITFKGPDENRTVDVDIEVKVDATIVHQQTHTITFVEGVDKSIDLSSNNFKNEDDDNVWNENLMDYECETHTIYVSADGDDISDQDSIDFRIDGDELSYTLTPSTPSLSDEMVVAVEDTEGDPLKGATAKFTWLGDSGNKEGWDASDNSYSRDTNSDGEAKVILEDHGFKTSYGKYQLDVYKANEYCVSRQVLDISNTLNITAEPAAPQVGDSFKLKVVTSSGKSATAVKVRMSPGNIEKIVRSDGYTDSFMVTAPGSYTFTTTGGGYTETYITINIAAKPPLAVTASPDPANLGEPVTISVLSSGSAVSGVTISLSKVGGIVQNLPTTTGSDGKIVYTPSDVGEYTVKASKAGYDDGTDTFSVTNKFQITAPPESELRVGSEATIIVKDQSGSPVSGVAVSISGSTTTGSTDSSGAYKLILDRVGRYDLAFKKNGFNDETLTLISKGAINLALSSKQIELGNSVTIKTTDSLANPIQATMVIKDPQGATQSATSSEYTYTPTKVGSFSVEASKQDYATSRDTFAVTPKKLSITGVFAGNDLKVNVSSRGKPVAGLSIAIQLPDGTASSIVTNEAGTAVLPNMAQYGNYTLSASSEDYEAVTETTVREKSLLSGPGIFLIVVLVIIVLLAIIAVILLQLISGRGRKETSFSKSGRTSLGG